MIKRIFLLVIFLFSILLNLFFIFRKDNFQFIFKKSDNLFSANVVRVIDGDTFDLDNGERIRLLEIDAPEYPKGCLSNEAKERLEGLISDKRVTFEKYKKDDFGRLLAYVYLDDVFINQVMIEEGWAYFKKSHLLTTTKTILLEKSEEEAKKLERGIWSSLCQSKRPGCLIKGNYRQGEHSRIYHTPDCYNYDRIIIKPGTQDRWFCNEDEAKKAGFVKSKDCP